MNTSASVKRLMQIKDVTKEDADLIRAIWNGSFDTVADLAKTYPDAYALCKTYQGGKIRVLKRLCIDEILRTHGVEYLGWHKRASCDVHYCNAGEAYATTILFIGGRLTVGCWGDLVERNLITEPTQF